MFAEATPPQPRRDPTAATHALLWAQATQGIDAVTGALRAGGHDVHLVGTGAAAWDCFEDHRPDVAVLALSLPSSIQNIERIRARYDGPLVCFGPLARAGERIIALTQGADDVVPAGPLVHKELALRVRSVLRRSHSDHRADEAVTCGPLVVDTSTHHVRMDGRLVHLTGTEVALLAFLARHPNTAFTRQDLLRHVWGYDVGDASTVSVHVRRLRRKIEHDPSRPALIRTVWGSGYYLHVEDA